MTHLHMKPPTKTARAERESALGRAIEDIIKAARNEGAREAYCICLDLVSCQKDEWEAARRIAALLLEVPK